MEGTLRFERRIVANFRFFFLLGSAYIEALDTDNPRKELSMDIDLRAPGIKLPRGHAADLARRVPARGNRSAIT